jgi:hypothetical protein
MHVSYAELVASRRRWIEEVLRPWCREARVADLLIAEQAWPDLAGQVLPEFTLWMWAWSRFPGLVIEELQRFDEAAEARVTLNDGRVLTGSPDGRHSQRDQLALSSTSGLTHVSLSDIASVAPLRAPQPLPERTITPSPD